MALSCGTYLFISTVITIAQSYQPIEDPADSKVTIPATYGHLCIV